MRMYQVGQRVAQFKGGDGLFLNIDDSGVFLLCRMAAPTAKERRAFHSRQPLRINMGEYAGILFWTVTFGEIPEMDCAFSPQIAPVPVFLPTPEPGQGYAMTVVLADGNTGEVISIRLVGLSHDFSLGLQAILGRISALSIDYQAAVSRLYSLSTSQLSALADYSCVVWEAGK